MEGNGYLLLWQALGLVLHSERGLWAKGARLLVTRSINGDAFYPSVGGRGAIWRCTVLCGLNLTIGHDMTDMAEVVEVAMAEHSETPLGKVESLLQALEKTGTYFAGAPAIQDHAEITTAAHLMLQAAGTIAWLADTVDRFEKMPPPPAPAAPVKVRKKSSLSGRKIEPKYRCNEKTWTGRGMKPQWVKEVESRGESIESYRIHAVAAA